MHAVRDFFKKDGKRYLKNAFLRLWRLQDPTRCFSVAVLLGALLFLGSCLVFGHRAFVGIFHLGATDLFSDFFAAISDAARGAAAYGERGVIYPPLANLVLLLLARLLPPPLLTGDHATLWRQYNGAVLCYVLFAAVTVALLFLFARRLTGSGVAALALCVCFPTCFLLERGNMLLLALLPLLLFCRGFDSACPARREAALVALAVAAALKVYPLLFALVLVSERRWCALGRLLGYTAVLTLLPSFCFGGPLALWLTVKNALSFTANGQNAAHFMQLLGLDAERGALVLALLYALALAVALIAALLRLPPWQLFALAATVLLCFSSIFSAYNWLLFLPALLALFENKCQHGLEKLYFWAISLPFFVYLPKPRQDNLLILLLSLLWGLLLFSCLRAAARSRRRAGR